MDAPVLVYDDDCGFCTWWAEFVGNRADVRLVGFSELDPALRERLPPDYEDCSHLVTDEAVYSCGASIEEGLARSDLPVRPVVERLRTVDAYGRLREWGYRRVADTRDVWGKLLSRTPPARTRDGESERAGPDEERDDGG